MRAAFITSTGRTGTDFFTYLFNDVVHNAWSLHEPKPAFRRRSYRYLHRCHGTAECLYFGATRRLRNLLHRDGWYVETNYHLFSAIPLLRHAFPEPLVVHIVRDGRDVVRSWLNRGRYLVPENQLTPFHLPADPAQRYWDDWNALQKLAWYWKTMNRVAENGEPDLLLHFEDIFTSRNSAVFQILERMPGIDYEPGAVDAALRCPVNANHRPLIPRFAEWPREWQQQFWDIAGEDMAYWGYA